MKKLSGIYCIENLVNGKKYIGQGENVLRRMSNKHTDSDILNNAFEKYGKDNFKRYVICYCEISELPQLEIECIKIFHSHKTDWGYNISWGGSAPMRGRRHSEESKKKISVGGLGKTRSEETKKRISIAKTGRLISDETLKRMSIAMTGEKHPNFGKHRSNETKSKMSKAMSGENNPNFGKPVSEEVRRKMSDSKKGDKNSSFNKKLGTTSEYIGVSRRIDKKKYIYWGATVRVNNKTVFIGSGKNEADVARLYDKYVIENKLNRPLNFPDKIGT